MSVTFSFPNSPTEEIRHDEGWIETVDLWPSANFANTNARNILNLLGLEDDGYLCGSLEPLEAPAVLRSALRARNLERLREPAVIPHETHGRFIECGSSDAQVQRRLDSMIEILKFAVEHKERLTWG